MIARLSVGRATMNAASGLVQSIGGPWVASPLSDPSPVEKDSSLESEHSKRCTNNF